MAPERSQGKHKQRKTNMHTHIARSAPKPPTGRNLAMRDSVRAAAFGLARTPHFGGESSFGGDYIGQGGMGFGFGYETVREEEARGRSYGSLEHGIERWGRGERRELGVDHRRLAEEAHMLHEEREQVRRWKECEARERRREENERGRRVLLDPNEGSHLKVERYDFPISQQINALGTPQTFINFFGQPDTMIRPERVFCNAPGYNFVLLNEVKVANVSAIVGGISDAFFYSATAVNSHLSLPTLTPANKLTVQGSYTGYVPPGYPVMPYQFIVAVHGPATVAGSD
jgi:hypothetical protein